MLTIVFALLTAVCLDGSDRRLTPREEKFISGIGCTQATSRKNCLSVLEADGNHRCLWKDAHCSALSPSNPNVHALDTLAIGCCRGFNFETQMECQSYTDEQGCKDDHCDWIETDDPSFCLMVATTDSPLTTTFNTFMASTDSETADNESTTTTSPETTSPSLTQATEEDAGCCRGNTWLHDDACNEHHDAVLCIKHDHCQWLVGSQPDLCPPLPTTTRIFTTDSESADDENTISSTMTTNAADAPMTTAADDETTISPSTTNAADATWTTSADSEDGVGCCKGDAPETNEKCYEHIDPTMCAADGKCEWLVGTDPDLCLFSSSPEYETTTESPMTTESLTTSQSATMTTLATTSTTESESVATTSMFGCCYPEEGINDRWKESCAAASCEQSCLEVSTHAGDLLCRWEAKAEEDAMDCATTTTTTSLAPGCCYGSTWRSQSTCMDIEDQVTCERNCLWMVTDDPSDCVLTTTATPTTTEEMGCCSGSNERMNLMCMEKSSSTACLRMSHCEWNIGVEDCTWKETTTASPMATDSLTTSQSTKTTDFATSTGSKTTTTETTTDENEVAESTTGAEWTTESEWTTAMETSTDAPWMGAKHRHGRRGGSVLYDQVQGSVVHRSQDYAISLTSVLLLALAAFIAYGVYQLVLAQYSRREYTKLSDDDLVQILYESA